jgi:hypothetical protein
MGNQMKDPQFEAEALALEISSCNEIDGAIRDSAHPCHQVVSWQKEKWHLDIQTVQESPMHRPEAWTGNLTKAPIIFISSNPSFNSEENFPSWQASKWSRTQILDFAMNRFSENLNRKYGATQAGKLANCDKTIEKNGKLSTNRVRYWSWVRKLVSFVLDKSEAEVSAIDDYVMTEIVHCKSEYEKGVVSARKKCKDKYLERIITLSPAKLIFVVGKNAALDMDAIFPGKFPKDWAEINGGFWPKTVRDFPELLRKGLWNYGAQKKHSVQIEIGGISRTVIYFAKPGGGGGLYSPWKNPGLVDPELLSEWRNSLRKN